jgi:hypothetical protein
MKMIQRSMFSCLRSSSGEIDECGVANDFQLVLYSSTTGLQHAESTLCFIGQW